MKKFIAIVLAIGFMFGLIGCRSKTPERIKTVKTDYKTYYELNDGSWECEGYKYKYRLKITGKMHDATMDSTFVYLSNIKKISFDQAWKAAGGSSDSNDYFSVYDAVLVDMMIN